MSIKPIDFKDEFYEVIFGPIERAQAKAVVQDEKAVAVEAEVLPVAKAGKTEGVMIPMLAVTVRRLHDLGDTGWLSVAIYLLPWLVGVGYTIYTDNFTDVTLDVIDGSIDGLMGLVGSYLVFYLFEFEALIARVIMMARKGTVGANEYGADPIRYIG